MEKKLYLLDGHALVYRAHYAFINRPLINSNGINTSAISGFVRFLWDILRREKPTHLAVAFDPKGKTFRHDDYEPYKANRDATPEDITTAFPYIRSIVDAFNIPIICVDNYEADDTIGTIAKQAEKEGFQVFMVTPDKDYAQLVSDNIFMYKPSRQGNGIEILGVPEVLEKWEIAKVEQVIDILGLQGDSVDNIPGIPGIGKKTAVKLLKLYDSVEGLIENVENLKGKQKENVISFAEQGLLSKRLATIALDVPITFDASAYLLEGKDDEKLATIFKDLEFRSIADKILGTSLEAQSAPGKNVQGDLFGGATPSPKTTTPVPAKPEYKVSDHNINNVDHDYKLVDTEEEMLSLAKVLAGEKIISFDTETTNIDANIAELVGMAFAIKAHEAYYVPVPEDKEEAKKRVAIFKPILENPDIIKIGQNIKYDILMMKWNDVELKGQYFDTMIAHYLLQPDLRHKLDFISGAELNYQMVPIEDLIGKGKNSLLTMRDVPIEKAKEYAGEDADITLQVKSKLAEHLDKEELTDLYYKVEEPLIDVLAEIEYNGVRIDGDFLRNYSGVLQKMITTEEKAVFELADGNFNIGSPKQVGEILFDKLKIPYRWRKAKTAQYSTDVTKLNELAVDHEIVRKILTYRKYSKLKSTYVDTLPLLINPKSGRIHSNFNQARAATGRLSSDKPNLQNIPIKHEAGREIRKAFIPRDEDHILLAADYSQIELRLIAEISKDKIMLDAFNEGRDFHTATAATVYDVDYDKVTPDQRRNAKTVNFSIIYGAGATNLSRQLDIPRKEAKELIDTYYTRFTGLVAYMHDTVEFAKENGYVKTLAGRKRLLRNINSRNSLSRSNAERMAINTPIQGSAADMIKLAMIDIHQTLKSSTLKSKMIMQVHDELVFDIYKPELEEMKAMIESKMMTALPGINVPIVVEAGIGKNWLEAH